MLLRPSNAINKADSESRHVVTVAIEAEKASTRDLKSLHGIWQKRHFNTEGKNLMVFDFNAIEARGISRAVACPPTRLVPSLMHGHRAANLELDY